MGLDNGIVVRNKTREQLPMFIKYPFDNDYNNEVDICYWRKWWGFRNEVVKDFFPNDCDTYEIKLSRKDIAIIRAMLDWYILYPEDATNGYWEDKLVVKTAKQSRWNLLLLYWYMAFHPDTEVYFYDSY